MKKLLDSNAWCSTYAVHKTGKALKDVKND